MKKRGSNVTTDRFFLTLNPYWNTTGSHWFKNSPIGKNTIATWNKKSAVKCGLDTKNKKITNHSSRATIISHMAKIGVNEQELIKISGHSNSSSIKPYLQLNDEHHSNIIDRVMGAQQTSIVTASSAKANNSRSFENCTFTNCVFN